ncbi:hypothetical protein ES703_04161 [subsurface metagenome]|nr:hypothetical protein [bacterium]
MKRMMMLFVGMVAALSATTVWIQKLQDPIDKIITLELGEEKVAVSLAFTLDDTAFVEIASGGMMMRGGQSGTMRAWIVIDGEEVQHTRRKIATDAVSSGSIGKVLPLDQTFGWVFEPGEHTIELWIRVVSGTEFSSYSYSRTRLEINLQLEEPSALSEYPPDQTPQPSSVITSAPFLIVEGCQRVLDVTGRVVIIDVQDGRVELNRLPTGIFFAETKDGYTVRIVKIK